MLVDLTRACPPALQAQISMTRPRKKPRSATRPRAGSSSPRQPRTGPTPVARILPAQNNVLPASYNAPMNGAPRTERLAVIPAWVRLDQAFAAFKRQFRAPYQVIGAQLAKLRILAEKPVMPAESQACLAMHPATPGPADRPLRTDGGGRAPAQPSRPPQATDSRWPEAVGASSDRRVPGRPGPAVPGRSWPARRGVAGELAARVGDDWPLAGPRPAGSWSWWSCLPGCVATSRESRESRELGVEAA